MRGLTICLLLTVASSTALGQTKTKDAPAGDGPKFAGRTFEQWVKDISHKDASKREHAIRAVCAFPPATAVKAVPALIAELKRHSPSTPVDLSVRVNICMALGDLFSMGEKIETRQQADAALALRIALRDSQAILRYRAARALETLGPESRSATPELTAMLRDTATWETRQAAATTLAAVNVGNPNGPPLAVLRSLYECLNDPSYQVRMAAVQALSILGPAGSSQELIDNYVAALLPIALKDPEPGLQIWARVAVIGATHDFKADNITPIIKHAANADPGVRGSAVQALGVMGDKAKIGVPTLIKSLNDSDPGVQIAAMWALARMHIYAADAIPVLQKIAADPNAGEYQKAKAKETIEKITPK